eukprot:3426675-Rhodomonas_salina.1
MPTYGACLAHARLQPRNTLVFALALPAQTAVSRLHSLFVRIEGNETLIPRLFALWAKSWGVDLKSFEATWCEHVTQRLLKRVMRGRRRRQMGALPSSKRISIPTAVLTGTRV